MFVREEREGEGEREESEREEMLKAHLGQVGKEDQPVDCSILLIE